MKRMINLMGCLPPTATTAACAPPDAMRSAKSFDIDDTATSTDPGAAGDSSAS